MSEAFHGSKKEHFFEQQKISFAKTIDLRDDDTIFSIYDLHHYSLLSLVYILGDFLKKSKLNSCFA